jgi:hypothetical protein
MCSDILDDSDIGSPRGQQSGPMQSYEVSPPYEPFEGITPDAFVYCRGSRFYQVVLDSRRRPSRWQNIRWSVNESALSIVLHRTGMHRNHLADCDGLERVIPGLK